jgi:hypothetical protein
MSGAFHTPDEYAAFIREREREILGRVYREVERAVTDVFEDDEIFAKGLSPLAANDGYGFRLAFRDGIGIDVKIETAYLPTVDEQDETTETVADVVALGLASDGVHHKQWALERVAETLGIDVPEHDPGIAP